MVGKSVGIGVARHVGVAGRVHGDAVATRHVPRAAEVGGVDQGRAGRVQLRHEGVVAAATVGCVWKAPAVVGKSVEAV